MTKLKENGSDKRWTDRELERGAEMADGSQKIQNKTAVSRLVCVPGWVLYRKGTQPAGAVCPSNQITDRERERERVTQGERENPLRNRCNFRAPKKQLKMFLITLAGHHKIGFLHCNSECPLQIT